MEMDQGIMVTIVIQSIVFIGALSKMFTDMKIKLRELDLRVRTLEKKEDEIGEKLTKIFDALQDIKLELKDKADRQ
jgi:chaperonin cofactor prefoldin